MKQHDFEKILDEVTALLNTDIVADQMFHVPAAFEDRVRMRMQERLTVLGLDAAFDPEIQGFPDIVVGQFGVEVKATASDSWRCIANSVSEGKRSQSVERIYVIYGKMGGEPEVKWADYGDSIIHVRTSHVPRFEIELGSERTLFGQIGISYDEFRKQNMHEKMVHIREYARGRMKPGERLWWLEDQQHTLPLEIRVYMDLTKQEKLKYRAEASLLTPKIVGSPSLKPSKYIDPAMYLMTYRGIICPQTRDLFSAGSAAGKDRGGDYVLRALQNIQDEMRHAADYLEDALFEEYWGYTPPKQDRILSWLNQADQYAKKYSPSDFLFLEEQGKNKFSLTFFCVYYEENIMGTLDNMGYSVISMFSGCGGMDLGFKGGFSSLDKKYTKLPFEIKWANDLNAAACGTYNYNIKHPIHHGSVWDFLDCLPESADVLIGGFPCQDLSVNGKQQGINGARSGLYRAMVEAVSKVQPKIFIAENVKALLFKKNESALKTVIKEFSELGYDVTYKLYSAADFGVAQNRERVLIVGIRNGENIFNPPKTTHSKDDWISAKAAVSDLEMLSENIEFSHIWSRASKSAEQGSRKLKAEKPSQTIRAECHGNIQFHYGKDRRISMREAARFQSFPDDFKFLSKLRETERMIGNAVPPVLAWHVAREIQKTLDNWVEKADLVAAE